MSVTTPLGDHFPPGNPFPVPSESARITALKARQAELERRIAELERQSAEQVPWTWPWTNMDDARCHVCQGRFKDMGLYVCNNDRCPSRVTYCAKTPYGTTSASDCGSVGTAQ